MSKRQFKSQASSSRALVGGFGGFSTTTSTLSYLSEPADLTQISDPNIVVAFKNLLKKDSTTKSKALDDLLAHAQAHPHEQGGVEQSILDAWVKQYPRTAIDNSRRVRELSHRLQYELLKSGRKRMEKHIPTTVGAWLAGTYDRDRPVSRAATDGLTSFLDSEDKVLMLWRRCQPQILSYAEDAIKETPQTLSDERAVNADEMQAKYDRVIGSSLSLVLNLLSKLSSEDILKYKQEYEAFLVGNTTLWKFVAADDVFVRRVTSELLLVTLDKQQDFIDQDLETVSAAVITDGMKAPQVGSVVAFLKALIVLSTKFPQVWTTSYKNKRTPISRLRHFIEKGSQIGPSEFWRLWGGLLKRLPQGVLPADGSGIKDFLRAQRTGISRRDESAANLNAAWESYITAVQVLTSGLNDNAVVQSIIESELYPLFEQNIRPSTDLAIWSVNNDSAILAGAFALCSEKSTEEALTTEWTRLTGLVIETMLVSLPEKSKDHAKSQNAVIAEGRRWLNLQAEILKLDSSTRTQTLLVTSVGTLVDKITDTLESRNGKPFGAAGILLEALKHTPSLISSGSATLAELVSFLEEDLPQLVVSPSSSYLIATLNALRTLPDQQKNYESIWQATVDGLLAAPNSSQKTSAIRSLISSTTASGLAQNDKDLQSYVLSMSSEALQGDEESYGVFESAVTFTSFSADSVPLLTNMVIESLHNVSANAANLRVLETVVHKMPGSLMEPSIHLSLITSLLHIAESADATLVTRIENIKKVLESTSEGGSGPTPTVQIVQDALRSASPASLSIETLVAQASTAFSTNNDISIADLYPDPQFWLDSLAPLLSYVPNPALALSNPLRGAIFLVDPTNSPPTNVPDRDSSGYSIPLRVALYTSQLIKKKIDSFEKLDVKQQVELLRILCITAELANDELDLQESNLLWTNLEDPSVEAEIQEFIANTRHTITSLVADEPIWRRSPTSNSVAAALVSALLENTSGLSPASFYQARALSSILSSSTELNGWQNAEGEEWLSSLKVLTSTTPDIFKATAVLSGLGESLESSKLVSTLCNRLVSDVAGATTKTQKKTASILVYLNAIMAVYESGDLPVAQNRLVFAVRQITSWMDEEPVISAPLAAEALKALSYLFPCITGVYGSHWSLSLNFATASLVEPAEGERLDSRLPLYTASIRHVALCRNILKAADEDDKNDDVEDALKQIVNQYPLNLIELLRLSRSKETQPWSILDNLLYRELEAVSVKAIRDPEDLYYLLASETRLVQSSVFSLLQRYTLANAESVNYDAVLEKQDAKLPQELLSLLLDPPATDAYTDEALSQFPAVVRTYLLTWHIIFDHYAGASYKVRLDYNTILKNGNYAQPLLDFIFEALGHSLNQPLNLDAARITPEHVRAYSLNTASSETPEYDMQWLLVHLYHQCLTYIPSLTKTWWMDHRSKQTRMSVESWTEKYISPLILDTTLDEVQTWSDAQTATDDDKELLVKISRKSREIYAGYEVDDMTAQIVIRLPSIYPLSPVSVDSVNRVAVSEKKWQSWLMITKGVITFSNGSITDGLTTFRKNISASLKGQTECAICYSIVSSDRKMPDKRCGTCKNLFHSDCLFKWFASSNQSTCPLCRNPFTYGDVRRRERT